MLSHCLLNIITTLLLTLPHLTTSITLSGKLLTIGSGGYPRALQLSSKTLLASYQSANSTIATLKVRHSTDQGATWSEEYIARSQTHPEGKRIDLNNGFLYQTPTGDVLCAYRRHVKNLENTILELNIEVSKSTDGGKTWEFLSTINSDPPRDGVKGDWEPFLRHNDEGKLEVYWAHEVSLPNQNTAKKVSDDEGKTWGPVITMTGTDIDARDGKLSISYTISRHTLTTHA
jgi:Neuraminidase (sialidase)